MSHDILFFFFSFLCLGQILQKATLLPSHCPFFSYFLHIYTCTTWDWEHNFCGIILFKGNFCQTQCLICAIVHLSFEGTKLLPVTALSGTLPSQAYFQYLLGSHKGNSAAYLSPLSWYIPLFGLKSSGVLNTCLPGCCLCWLSQDRCPWDVFVPFFCLKGRVLANKPLLKS